MSDGGSHFKLTARGRQGLKSHMLVGSMCAGTWRRESVAAPRYLYDPKRKTQDEKRMQEKPWKIAVKTLKKRGWVITTYVMVLCIEYILVCAEFIPVCTWYVIVNTCFYLFATVNTQDEP